MSEIHKLFRAEMLHLDNLSNPVPIFVYFNTHPKKISLLMCLLEIIKQWGHLSLGPIHLC